MRSPRSSVLGALGALTAGALILAAQAGADAGGRPGSYATHPPTPTVFASGLNNPRGLAFSPSGDLYVAEGGTGGTSSTSAAECAQVVAPIGPYTGSTTGADIVKVDHLGNVQPVATGFPSSQTAAGSGALVSGVAAVTFLGDQLYAVLGGAGCSHGVPALPNGQRVPNGIVKVNADGTWEMTANLSAFQAAHPVAHPEPDDFEPDGTWFSLLATKSSLLALEPNHGEIDRIRTDGTVSRVVDVSASQGHIVPTTMTIHHGSLYFANLGTFPIVPGSENVYRLDGNGHVQVVAHGLTTVLGLAFKGNRLYALETATAAGNPAPGTGAVVRVNKDGTIQTVVDKLSVPTAMTFGPDGALYVSNNGFGAPPGAGQVLRIVLN